MKAINFFFGVTLLAATLASGTSAANSFPERPVKIVVPFGAGGLTDILARAMGQELSNDWKQAVIVENKPGASGAIAAKYVAQSEPDGYTLLLANDTALSVNQYLYRKLSYNPEKDFRAVHNIAGTRNVLLASKKSGLTTFQSLLDAARKQPGQITYGSFGIGTTPHLVTEEIATLSDIELNHIPYKGNAETVVAILGGQIDVSLVAIPTALPLVQSDQVNVLGIISNERYNGLPNVPTLAEAGLKGLDSHIYFGLVAPIKTPDDVVNKISASIAKVINDEEFKKAYIVSKGMESIDQKPDEFDRFLKEDRARYKKRIQSMNLSLD